MLGHEAYTHTPDASPRYQYCCLCDGSPNRVETLAPTMLTSRIHEAGQQMNIGDVGTQEDMPLISNESLATPVPDSYIHTSPITEHHPPQRKLSSPHQHLPSTLHHSRSRRNIRLPTVVRLAT